MSDWKTDYPSQYYAYSNTAAMLGGYPSVGWVDVGIFTHKPSWLPAASDMIALTSAEWDERKLTNQIIKDGKIVGYTVDKAPIPLTAQATTALKAARQTVWNEYGSLNETTPDAWVTYLKALSAIASGTDTTSTTLPEEPVV